MYTVGQFVKVTGNPGANLRSTPSAADDSNIMQGIPQGSVVPVVGDSSNGFANVTYLGMAGYVSETYVTMATGADVIAPQQIQPSGYRITGSGVSIRSGPTLNDGIVATTGAMGETFLAYGPTQNGYAQGSYTNPGGEEFRGWIAEQYLGFGQAVGAGPLTRPLPGLPIAKPNPTVPVTPVAQQPPPAKTSGAVLAGGLLALALVIYFMAK